MKRLTVLWFVVFGIVALVGLPLVYAAIPSGATLSPISNETAPSDSAGSHAAIAGNITEMDLTAFSTTQSWAGYYGNVTGTIQLADAEDHVLYNWSLTSPEGEVFASTNDTINWAYISCFNFTSTGAGGTEAGQAGATSLTGMNLSQLEAIFNVVSDDVDGVNETFGKSGSLPGNDGTHDQFWVNSLQFDADECNSANMYRDAGSGAGPVDDYFEEVLLLDTSTQSVIFTTLLEEVDTQGFDEAYHDFQVMVLEDGHGADTSPTTYYFYVEIE